MSKIDLTRTQLYELVWEKPLLHIIQIYGGTYQEMKEMLKKYRIPIPENGHWARIKAGYNIPKPQLPPMSDEHEKIIYYPKKRKKRIKKERRLSISKAGDRITHTADSLVAEAQKVYQKEIKGRQEDQVISIAYQSLDIRVSPKMIDRALGFFNSLILGVKRMGGEINIEPHTTSVLYSGETMEISLREKQNRITKENPESSWERYEYRPSGILYFKVGKNSWNSKEWKDTAYTTISDKIDEILGFLKEQAALIREHRRELELLNIKWEKERQQEAALEKQRSRELAAFVQLKTNAELWEKAEIIRKYLLALEETVVKQGKYNDEMQAYLEWARKKAEWYDPLTDMEDELLEEVNKATLTPFKKSFW